VLVDTPPLLAVTDPSVVAPCVDGVVLVVRISRRNHGPNAERAMEMLSALGAQVMGVVVNGVNPAGRFGAYTYRSYGYGNAYASAYDKDSDANRTLEGPEGNGQRKRKVVVIHPSCETLVDCQKPSD
jgi:Mrp family chromosome partitioning ATPase